MSQTSPRLEIACTDQCSFRPEAIGSGAAAALLAIKENGAGIGVFQRRAEEILGHKVPRSNVARHLKHYREVDVAEASAPDPKEKVTDLEILDSIISAGARNSKNWKPTIGDTLKAMEMKLRLTGNSAFEDMLEAMAIASTDEEDADEETPEAAEALVSDAESADDEEEGPLPEPAM